MARKIIPAEMEQYRPLFPAGYLEDVYGVDRDAQQVPNRKAGPKPVYGQQQVWYPQHNGGARERAHVPNQQAQALTNRPYPNDFVVPPASHMHNQDYWLGHPVGDYRGGGMAHGMLADFILPYPANPFSLGQNGSNLPRFTFPDPFQPGYYRPLDRQAGIPVPRANVPRPFNQPEPLTQRGRNVQTRPRPNVRVADMTVTLKGKKYEILQIIEGPNDEISGMNAGIRVLYDTEQKIHVVEKRVPMGNSRMRERAVAEKKALIQIAKAGGSPNVNKFYQAIWEPGKPTASLLIAYCNRGSLEKVIDEFKEINWKIPEKFCLKTLYDIASALCMTHLGIRDPMNEGDQVEDWNTICHLDIKSANVFLDYHGPYEPCGKPLTHYKVWPRVILGDFGCAVTREDIMSKKIDHRIQPYGTPNWFPPEGDAQDQGLRGLDSGCEKGAFGKFTDIWAMGGVIQAMCRLKVQPEQFWVDQMRGAGKDYSGDLNEAINKCMARNITQRPTALDVAKGIKSLMDSRGY